jgi:hypothetical protein
MRGTPNSGIFQLVFRENGWVSKAGKDCQAAKKAHISARRSGKHQKEEKMKPETHLSYLAVECV